MELNEYQEKAMQTMLPECNNELYPLMGLCEEVGELQGKIAKGIRKGIINFDGNSLNFTRFDDPEAAALLKDIKAELGDVRWMVEGITTMFGWRAEDVAKANLAKLADRKKRGVIVGNGDNR